MDLSTFVSTHKLDFESTEGSNYGDYKHFRVGTCHGLWDSCPTAYLILTVNNEQHGNGHFTDLLEWFEVSCKRDNRDLIIQKVWNKRLKRHLVNKRGFVPKGANVVKRFRDIQL